MPNGNGDKFVTHEHCGETMRTRTPLWAFLGVCSFFAVLLLAVGAFAYNTNVAVTEHIITDREQTVSLRKELVEMKLEIAENGKELKSISETLIRMEKKNGLK